MLETAHYTSHHNAPPAHSIRPSYNPFEESPSHAHPVRSSRWRRSGRLARRWSLLALKVFLAVATGSLGVLSEALHSGLDLMAAILTWLSVRVSDQPADSGHTYGHGKIREFSPRLSKPGCCCATSVYIIVEAFVRLLFKQVQLQPSALAIVILGVAMGIDIDPFARAGASGAGIPQRGARSRRASFLDRRLEHVCRDPRAWPRSGSASTRESPGCGMPIPSPRLSSRPS